MKELPARKITGMMKRRNHLNAAETNSRGKSPRKYPGKLFVLLTLILLACSCPALPLLPLAPTPTPTPSPTPSPTWTAGDEVPPPPLSADEAPFQFAWDDRQPFRANLSDSAQSVLDELPGATVYHLAFSFGDPPNHALGLEEIRYTNTEIVPLNEVDLALFPNLLGGEMRILSTDLNDAPVTPRTEDWLMRLPLDPPLLPGEVVTLRIAFEVTVPSGGGGYYYGIFGYNSGILSFAHAYPTILVYNEEGWNNQKPDLDGDPLFADASFYIVSVDAPARLTLVASGVEIEHTETGDRQKVLIANGPARDFYLSASTNWVRESQITSNGVTVNLYAPPNVTQEDRQQALSYGTAAIETFSQRYGEYPYTEFDIAPIVTQAGGVEYPGMTSIASDGFAWGEFLEIVIVHETAHMWFYNLVGNDTQDQPWLDEAMAQFVTWQYYLDRYGEESAEMVKQFDLQSTWDMSSNPDAPIGLPVSAYPGSEYAAIVYGRGPFFLMALRDEMGVKTFDRFLRDYVRQYSWSIASTEAFKSLAEQHCTCDLTPLFEEWVYGR
jgi:hypothetical protein